MILTDANLLLYAYNLDAAEHDISQQWLETQLSGPNLFCFAWQTISAFLRISTNQRAFAAPLSTKEATTMLLTPRRKALDHLPATAGVRATGPLVMDAHLAALVLEHGAALASS